MPISFTAKLADVRGAKEINKIVVQQMRQKALKPNLKKDAEKTVRGWKGEKPAFALLIKESPKNILYFTLYMRGSAKAKNKWNWLDLGTKPHPIAARRAPYLVFQTGYNPGSRPYSQGSRRLVTSAARRFGPYRKKKAVQHPGFPGRGWRKILAKIHKKPFERAYVESVNYAVKRSGHEYKKR